MRQPRRVEWSGTEINGKYIIRIIPIDIPKLRSRAQMPQSTRDQLKVGYVFDAFALEAVIHLAFAIFVFAIPHYMGQIAI